MSSEISDLFSTVSKLEHQKKSRISYTRDFLLSLGSLDAYKKWPSGFDASRLSEFEDAFNDTSERYRISGGTPFQSSRYNDHSSDPKYKPEASGGYSRRSLGRWEPRTSGSNSKDGDSDQADGGRHFGNQSRRSWQPPEHDGLLGSGAFPRSGYVGPPAPRTRTGQFQLNKSSEPYQPPRPYKALPFQRKEGNDSRNDETFGSAEFSSEDKAEEERRRRASFEFLRKEQHKQWHDKQKQMPENDSGKVDTDIVTLLDKSVDKINKMQEHEKEEEHPSLSQNDNRRSTVAVQTPVNRPLVPPGFASSSQGGKSHCTQSSSPHMVPEAKLAVIDKLSLDATKNEHDKNNQFASSLGGFTTSLLLNDNEKSGVQSSDREVLQNSVSENFVPNNNYLRKDNDVWKETTLGDVQNKRGEKNDVIDSFNHNSSTSVLEKWFGNALSNNFGKPPTYSENESLNMDEGTWSPGTSESSKFARWFCEEEKKPEDDFSSKELLSLIVNNEKTVPTPLEFFSGKTDEHIIPSFDSEINLSAQNLLVPPSNSLMTQTPTVHPQVDKPDSNPTVLTCEDLEQFMLAEVKDSDSRLEHPIQGTWTMPDKKSEEQKVHIDNHASQHILSLLQKGTAEKDNSMIPTSAKLDTGPFDKLSAANRSDNFNVGADEAGHGISEASSVQKTLTLEALFGAAFMNELQSAEAPVSTKRVSDDVIRSTPMVQHGNSSAEIPQYEASNADMLRSHVAPFLYVDNGIGTEKLDNTRDAIAHYGPSAGIENCRTVISGPKVGAAGFEVGASEVHLPEEDSLIAVSGSLDSTPWEPFPFADTSKSMVRIPEKAVGQLHDQLVNAAPKDADQQPIGLDDHYPVNVYHHLQDMPSQLPHLRNQPRVPFPDLEQRNQQMKFISPEGIPHDPHLTFPANIVPPNTFNHTFGPRYDHSHNLMLPGMPIPGNFPPQVPSQDLPRGISASHPINQMQGYMPELNNMHHVPLHHQQPNYGGIGMGAPGPMGGGINHPEAFQRLIDMELRANQVHAAAAGHFPAMYGPELERTFLYR